MREATEPIATMDFSLQTPSEPDESRPLTSRLLKNGEPTSLSLPGYSLLHQFLTDDGYLFITDADCAFEETTYFTWCDHSFRQVSSRAVGAAYSSFTLERVEWLDPQCLLAVFHHDDPWLVTIRRWSIPYLWPRLKVKRVKSPGKAVGV